MNIKNIKKLIGEEFSGFKIIDAEKDIDSENISLKVEFLDDYNQKSRVTITYLDKYGLNYLVNGEPFFDYEEALFENQINNYTHLNYIANNFDAMYDEEKSKKAIFQTVMDFLLMDEKQKFEHFGYFITAGIPNIWLSILKKYSHDDYEYNELEFNEQLLKRIDSSMLKYLRANPEYIEKLNMIDSNLKDLVRNVSVKSHPNPASSQPNQ